MSPTMRAELRQIRLRDAWLQPRSRGRTRILPGRPGVWLGLSEPPGHQRGRSGRSGETRRHPALQIRSRPAHRSSLAFDAAHHRLLSATTHRKLVVLNTDTGEFLAALPIGWGVDGAAYDPELRGSPSTLLNYAFLPVPEHRKNIRISSVDFVGNPDS